MDEMPSRSAWDKLDQRLRSHKTDVRLKWVQRISVAAAVLALISFAVASAFYVNFQSQKQELMAEHDYHLQVEDFIPQEVAMVGIYDVDKIRSLHEFLKSDASHIN